MVYLYLPVILLQRIPYLSVILACNAPNVPKIAFENKKTVERYLFGPRRSVLKSWFTFCFHFRSYLSFHMVVLDPRGCCPGRTGRPWKMQTLSTHIIRDIMVMVMVDTHSSKMFPTADFLNECLVSWWSLSGWISFGILYWYVKYYLYLHIYCYIKFLPHNVIILWECYESFAFIKSVIYWTYYKVLKYSFEFITTNT